ncbi:hypothetical protein, partial [Falsibacillus albus]
SPTPDAYEEDLVEAEEPIEDAVTDDEEFIESVEEVFESREEEVETAVEETDFEVDEADETDMETPSSVNVSEFVEAEDSVDDESAFIVENTTEISDEEEIFSDNVLYPDLEENHVDLKSTLDSAHLIEYLDDEEKEYLSPILEIANYKIHLDKAVTDLVNQNVLGEDQEGMVPSETAVEKSKDSGTLNEVDPHTATEDTIIEPLPPVQLYDKENINSLEENDIKVRSEGSLDSNEKYWFEKPFVMEENILRARMRRKAQSRFNKEPAVEEEDVSTMMSSFSPKESLPVTEEMKGDNERHLEQQYYSLMKHAEKMYQMLRNRRLEREGAAEE